MSWYLAYVQFYKYLFLLSYNKIKNSFKKTKFLNRMEFITHVDTIYLSFNIKKNYFFN
jgi:hypothetical protein